VIATSRPLDGPKCVLFIGADQFDFDATQRFVSQDAVNTFHVQLAKELPSVVAIANQSSFAAILVSSLRFDKGDFQIMEATQAVAPHTPLVMTASE
jgi:hypothetical protein